MELHASDAAALEGVIAKAAQVMATFQKYLAPALRPELAAMLDSTLQDLAGALCLLDPTAEAKDFQEHVRAILEREGRKAAISSSLVMPRG